FFFHLQKLSTIQNEQTNETFLTIKPTNQPSATLPKTKTK
ncbi:hypothetical protein DOY81_011958, partial [Sarcophaga bullata]